MIFGVDLTWQSIIFGGLLTMLVLVFQVLVGLRIIRFKGRRHARVHKNAGFAVTVLAAGHGLLALAVYNSWSILS